MSDGARSERRVSEALVGIDSDPAAVADRGVLRDCIAEGFDEVCGVAS